MNKSMRKKLRNAAPTQRRQAPAAPDPVLEGLRGLASFFGFQPPRPAAPAGTPSGRPLWWCLKCNISVGEWNPLDEVKQLYCPRCRQPMKVGSGPNAPSITINIQPAIDVMPRRLEIAAPATSTHSKEEPDPGKAHK